MHLSMFYNLSSIFLGLLAWALPVIGLCRKQHRAGLACGSLSCAALSLYFQLLEVMNRINLEDSAAIYDTIHAVCLCATVLLAVTMILNLAAWMKTR